MAQLVVALRTPPPAYPERLRADVERYLESLRFSSEFATAGLEEAMRYSLLAGGKRIRPVLALATAEATGRDPASVLPLAAALELIHTYSLIHDDLPAMDDDDLRRGRLTCHKAFGEDVAILAGDGLYAEAFRLLLAEQRGEPAAVLAAACELAAATGVQGMVGGQYLDVAATAPAGAAGLRRLHELKTGRLIAASIECVLLLAGERDPTLTGGLRQSDTSERLPASWACCSRSSTTFSTSPVQRPCSASSRAATSGSASAPT